MRPSLALAAALVLPGGWLEAAACPAAASFPGANGRVVFASERATGAGVANPEGDFEIFRADPDGSDVKQLTKHTADDTQPAWSADGGRLAFTRDLAGNAEISTMGASGADPTDRTDDGGGGVDPDGQAAPLERRGAVPGAGPCPRRRERGAAGTRHANYLVLTMPAAAAARMMGWWLDGCRADAFGRWADRRLVGRSRHRGGRRPGRDARAAPDRPPSLPDRDRDGRSGPRRI